MLPIGSPDEGVFGIVRVSGRDGKIEAAAHPRLDGLGGEEAVGRVGLREIGRHVIAQPGLRSAEGNVGDFRPGHGQRLPRVPAGGATHGRLRLHAQRGALLRHHWPKRSGHCYRAAPPLHVSR